MEKQLYNERTRIRVAIGNDLPLCKRLMSFNGSEFIDIQAVEVLSLKVFYGTGVLANATELAYSIDGAFVHFKLTSQQIEKVGRYNIWITGIWQGDNVAINIHGAIDVVNNSIDSNVREYIHEGEVDLGNDFFIPPTLTDEELEALKLLYQQKVSEAEAVKAEWERKVEELNGVAKQGSNPNATITDIQQLIERGVAEYDPVSENVTLLVGRYDDNDENIQIQ